ncbi:hypothetical protein BaRGS_00035766 [Batillaria attramentaria]|uniref:Beta-hexosaminidase n=1 Tax=Batillaria attramentaria TaxID=370345 RepID=A0ABD0JDP7_9CAEN
MEKLRVFRLYVAFLVVCFQYCAADITFIAERFPLQGNRELSDVPWPMPTEWSRDNVTFTLSPTSLKFAPNLPECDVIHGAITRYRRLMSVNKETDPPAEVDIEGVNVIVENTTCEKYPYLDMDESYTISTGPSSISLTSQSVWGALRGLETLSQLLYEENGQVRIRNWTITDNPRFSHRGFLIDTSRHYLPLSIIKKHLDAMTWSKMNVLHWHIVDAQSFPYVSHAFPELSEKGAYSPRHVYTPEAVAEVIEYARLRGIRVVPEFDTPGHAHSWGKAKPDLLTPCWSDGKPYTAEYGQHTDRENFDPSRETTFQFLEEFMNDVASVFPDQFLHAGMDEAHYMWKEAIIWQDPLDNGVVVSNSTLIEVWKNKRNIRDCTNTSVDNFNEFALRAAKGGNRLIISSCWYLNYLCYGEDWRRFYKCDPTGFTVKREEMDQVVGGEACLWAEFVDGTNFLQRSWPRAAAVAERLWSPSHVTDADTAAFRLDAHRCRLLRRGIPAQPVLPGYCGDYDYGLEPEAPEGSGDEQTCPTGKAMQTETSSTMLLLSLIFTLAATSSA